MKFLDRKDLLGLEDLSKEEINLILETALSFREVGMREVKKVPALRGMTLVNYFAESSTRTRTSFELAAKRLSADVVNIQESSSSVQKGETLIDTARTVQAMSIDFLVIRHSCSGAPHMLAPRLTASVVNAGDGIHEHPTQGLLDLLTIQAHKGKIEGLRVVLVGDITHSRVARSNIWGLTKLGAEVTVVGPATLIPQGIESLGVRVLHDVDEALVGADVINILRIQLERQEAGLFPSVREYAAIYGINEKRLSKATNDVLVLHPGPMNRGIEIASAVADGVHSVITEQVTNGVATRMAVLYLLAQARRRKEKGSDREER